MVFVVYLALGDVFEGPFFACGFLFIPVIYQVLGWIFVIIAMPRQNHIFRLAIPFTEKVHQFEA